MDKVEILQSAVIFFILFILFLISLKIVFRILKNYVYRLLYSGFIIPLIYYYSSKDSNVIKEVIKTIIN